MVVIVVGLELSQPVVDTDTGGRRKAADPVRDTAVFWRDEVGQRLVVMPARLFALLAQVVQRGAHLLAGIVSVDLDVVTHRIGRKQANDGGSTQPLVLDDLCEHRCCVGVKLARLHALVGIVEDLREPSLELPRMEKEGPVDVRHDLREIDVVEHRDARVHRCDDSSLGPVDRCRVGACFGQRNQAGGLVLCRASCAHLFVLAAQLGEKTGLVFVGQQRTGHTDRARGIGDIHGTMCVLRFYLDRGVRLRCRRATDHQRDAEALTRHLPRQMHHLVQ